MRLRKNRDYTFIPTVQAYFMITHSSGDFIVENIHNHHLYNLQTCIKVWWEISMFCSIATTTQIINY